MIRNILLSAFASLKRKKMASLFTILTISLGMTMIVLLASLYHSYTGNLGPYVNRDRCLYVSGLSFKIKGEVVSRYRHKNATSTFINDYVRKLGDEALVGMYGFNIPYNIGSKYKPLEVRFLDTDANFWKIHHFSFISGKPFTDEQVKNNDRVCILSRKAADFLFNSTDVVGKTFVNEEREYRVAGVIEDGHPHFNAVADFYIPYTIGFWDENRSFNDSRENREVFVQRGRFTAVIMANRKADFPKLKKDYNRIISLLNKTGKVEEFDEVKSELRSSAQLIPAMIGFVSDQPDSYMFVLMGLIFLLLPVFILSNVNLYALRERLEEIGIRKSFGAKRRDIILQFFIENILITTAGCILALLFALPINKILGYILYQSADIPGFQFNFSLFFYLVLGTFVFGILTVIVPVIRISKIHPVTAIHQNTVSGKMQVQFKTRKKWLQIATYFLLFMVLSLCCYIIKTFQSHLSNMGYQTENVLMLMVGENDKEEYDDQYNSNTFKGFRESLLRIAGVEKVSYVLENPPFWIVPQYQEYVIEKEGEKIRTLETDSVFFDLLKIKPVKGQVYSSSPISGNYIPAITTLAGEKLLFDGASIGKIIKRKSDGQNIKIIGVIEKYKHHPQTSYQEGIMVCRNRPSRSVMIKYHPETNLFELEKQIKETIQNWNGGKMSLSQNVNIDVERKQSMRQSYTSYHAILLATSFLLLNAFLGYLTLIYYNVRTRKEEMGIRRATGANKGRIMRTIVVENLTLMLIGSSIAILVLWQILLLIKMDMWGLFWSGLIAASVIGVLMTIVSALIPATKAAKVQPVEALAEE